MYSILSYLICQINYPSKFLLNTLILPAGLQLLVFLTWASNSRTARKAKAGEQPAGKQAQEDAESAEELELELKASRFGDHYFAFFLTYPTVRDKTNSSCFSTLTSAFLSRR